MASFSPIAPPSPISPGQCLRTTENPPTRRVSENDRQSSPWNFTTYIALLTLVALWAVQVYATWAAWGNLTIDSGHEMYIPSILAQGKVLYRDVWFPYGPASPYFNSYLFRLFGVKLNVLYWAGSLSALGSAILLYLVGMRLSLWHVGWTAGAILLLQGFSPSLFCFPLPYSFSTVYGYVLGCLFLWLAMKAVSDESSWWILGAGTTAAAAILFKPEFGTACYGTLALLVAVRGYLQNSWKRVAGDVVATLPGVVSCILVVLWMVSVGGVDFLTQENLVGWPTSYFMKTYGKMWLKRTGFTVSASAFEAALIRAIPLACVLLAAYAILWWNRSDLRARLIKTLIVLVAVLALAKTTYITFAPMQIVRVFMTTIFFPQDMVLYIVVAAVVAWMFFWVRRNDRPASSAKIALLFTFSGLLAFRILMNMRTEDYPIFYNGPVILSFLLLARRIIPRSGRSRRFVMVGELLICLACLVTVALPTISAEARVKNYVPLTTERGTIRAPKALVENYNAAIAFMKEKAAAGESVLSVPEDTSLYFLSSTYSPTRVFSFTPGIVAPGVMTEKMVHEIDAKP
ncbi:MAG TPA: hypothetical protein VFE02_05145, partial [Candidatus Acidoferrales bacterium]|nr:hypothetical protein [Candidatus Acidoferrales bacterium]